LLLLGQGIMIMSGLGCGCTPIPKLNQRLLREGLIFTSIVNQRFTNLMIRIIGRSSFLLGKGSPGLPPGFPFEARVQPHLKLA
jgi:hypothetical protein